MSWSQSPSATPYYIEVLRNDLDRRKRKNPRYSLRAYARFLGLDPSALSRLLSGKQEISVSVCRQLVRKLDLPVEEKRYFLLSAAQKRKESMCQLLATELHREDLQPRPLEIDPGTYERIADCRILALLEATFLDDFEDDPRWLAPRLGVSETFAREAIEALLSVGLLERRDGRLRKASAYMSVADKQRTSAAHRSQQRQVLERAVESLEQDPLDKRGTMAMVMAIDPDKLPIAKRMMQAFMDELCDYLTAGRRTRIYQLGVQLFPIQKEIQ
jgi:uncharacterized protein (TIGR02147 family)